MRTAPTSASVPSLRYDENKDLLGVENLHVLTPLMEGPRGVRVGDSVTSLMLRFRHGEGGFDGSATVLYGENGVAPYGEVRYEDSGAYLTYLAPAPDCTVALYLNCTDMSLSGFMLAVLDAQ